MKQLLSFPPIYNLFQFLVGKCGLSQATLFAKYLPYLPGKKVLDLGCGPGTCSHYFDPQDYLGIDNNSSYIKHAQKKYPRHTFLCGDFDELVDQNNLFNFDIIFAMGLFHHIDDQTALRFLTTINTLLSIGGTLITFDGCYYSQQNIIRRKIVLSDRGQYIRSPNAYLELARQAGFTADHWLEEDIYLIPHSMHVMGSSKSAY